MTEICESCGRPGPFFMVEFAATAANPGTRFEVCGHCVADAMAHPS